MITSDWHLHSRNSYDCRGAPISTSMAQMVADIEAAGILDYGITDHFNTPLNMPDLEASRAEFEQLPPSPHRHFGVEVSCMSQWELDEIAAARGGTPVQGGCSVGPDGAPPAIALTAADIARLKIEYVVGGTHQRLNVPLEREALIRNYHRQNLFLACHPLVTIVAHPWWWAGHWRDSDGLYRTDPWFDTFRRVPASMHDEFAAAAREHGTVVEINLYAMLLNRQYPLPFRRQYCEYLAGLKAAGVTLSIGSDHHAQHHRYADGDSPFKVAGTPEIVRFSDAVAMLDSVGITDAELWRLRDT